jgi:hypothetical protein
LLTGDKAIHPPPAFPVASKPVHPLRLRALLINHLNNDRATHPTPRQ